MSVLGSSTLHAFWSLLQAVAERAPLLPAPHLDCGHVLRAVVQQRAHKVKRQARLRQLGALLVECTVRGEKAGSARRELLGAVLTRGAAIGVNQGQRGARCGSLASTFELKLRARDGL